MVGKRLGRNRWSPSNPKTGEGSVAFTISVVLAALFLRLLGLTEEFSVSVFHMPRPLACGVSLSARSSSTLLMAVILGFQVQWCCRTFLAAGGILHAERQSNITCVPLEHGRAGSSVGIIKGRPAGDFKLQGMTSVVPEGQWRRGDLLRVCGLVTGVGILNRTSIRCSPHSPRPLFFPSFATCTPRSGSRRRALCFPCPLDCRNSSSCRLVRDQSLPSSTTPNERPRRREGPTAGKVSTTDADDPANPC